LGIELEPVFREKALRTRVRQQDGPGAEFELLLATHGITLPEDCHCRQFLQKMNAWGPDGCDERFRFIVEFWDFEFKRQQLAIDASLDELVQTAIDKA